MSNQRRQEGKSRAPALEKARTLILRYGWNATAYQIVNPGISLWFSEQDDAVIGYVTKARTRVVAGAPVCSNERLQAVVRDFGLDAMKQREQVCYFGAGERLETLLTSTGRWSAASLGAQPSWNPRGWDNILQKRSSVRAQLNRARNKGVSVRRRNHSDPGLLSRLRACLAEWLETRGLPPLHFLIEPETLTQLEDRILIVAERAGEVVGFIVASPVPARNGWLIEQIIRGREAPNGTAELLIHGVMTELNALSADYVTLGLSPLSRHSHFDANRMPGWLRLTLRWLRAHGKRFYNFEGLDNFKSKFQPDEWEEIVALADSPSFPPRAMWAVAAAFTSGSPIIFLVKALANAAAQELRWARRKASGP